MAERRTQGWCMIFIVVGAVALLPSLGCGSSSRETAAGRRASNAAQPCRTGDYLLRLSTNGATGGIVGVVQIRSKAATSCRLETQLRFSAQHADGSPVREVDGNPALLALRASFSPSMVLVRDWIWRNWCGRRLRAVGIIASGATAITQQWVGLFASPGCRDRRQHSTLATYGLRILH